MPCRGQDANARGRCSVRAHRGHAVPLPRTPCAFARALGACFARPLRFHVAPSQVIEHLIARQDLTEQQAEDALQVGCTHQCTHWSLFGSASVHQERSPVPPPVHRYTFHMYRTCARAAPASACGFLCCRACSTTLSRSRPPHSSCCFERRCARVRPRVHLWILAVQHAPAGEPAAEHAPGLGCAAEGCWRRISPAPKLERWLVCALQGETPGEIAGLAKAMLSKALSVSTSQQGAHALCMRGWFVAGPLRHARQRPSSGRTCA